jgi:epoxyqueuosine reductase
MIAIGNAQRPELLPVIERGLDEVSPLVRAMAVWALSITDRSAFQKAVTGRRTDEKDPAVRAEYDRLV